MHLRSGKPIPDKLASSNFEKPDFSQFKASTNKKILESSSKSQSTRKRQHIKIEFEADTSEKVETSPSETMPQLKRDKTAPQNWEIILNNIREMRKNKDAPVDSKGCDQCHDDKATPKDKRFQILIALMLSSQTKDDVNYAAMSRLKEHGCSLPSIIDTPEDKLAQLIYPVSFYKNKAKHIKKAADMMKSKFNEEIPNTVDDLCKLPGVGPKMAHLCMNIAWGQITGIGVDTHVHRISNRLKWTKSKTPEETRKALEDWLPYELWSEVNHLLVGFGQTVCKPIHPQCSTCLNKKICPSALKS